MESADRAGPVHYRTAAVGGITEIDILTAVLGQWKSAVDAHDPQRVATYFTDDAIFQGLHPFSIGADSVTAYYDSQPIGMTAEYAVLQTRRLAEDVVLGYLSVDFGFTDRPTLNVYLSLILRRTSDTWLISHYQVSRLGDSDSNPPFAAEKKGSTVMEFLVDMVITVPEGTTGETVENTKRREAARTKELATQGHVLRLWKPPEAPGEWRTLGLFNANGEDELRHVLASMPLHAWMAVTVTPFTPHPSDPAVGRPRVVATPLHG